MTVASSYVNELLEILKSTSNAKSSFKISWDMQFGKLLTAICLVMYLLMGLSFFKNSSLTGYNQIGTVDYFALQIKMFLNNSRGRNALYPSICNPFMNYCCSLNQHSTRSCYHLSSY